VHYFSIRTYSLFDYGGDPTDYRAVIVYREIRRFKLPKQKTFHCPFIIGVGSNLSVTKLPVIILTQRVNRGVQSKFTL